MVAVLGNHDYRGDTLAQFSSLLTKKDKRWLCLRTHVIDAGETIGNKKKYSQSFLEEKTMLLLFLIFFRKLIISYILFIILSRGCRFFLHRYNSIPN